MSNIPVAAKLPHLSKLSILAATLISIFACQTTTPKVASQLASAPKGIENIDDLVVVDCQLPGMVKMLGTMKYVTPRRAARLTANECSIRGGEYVFSDRASLDASLNIWLPQAQDGDAVAQNYVGQLYETGVNRPPDFQLAALWYQRAAEQNLKAAQVNLGFLYEMGRGVSQDKKKALNLYRAAAGLDDDQLEYESVIEQRIAERLQQFQGQLKRHQRSNAELEQKLQALYAKHNVALQQLARSLKARNQLQQTTSGISNSAELRRLNKKIKQLEQDNQGLLANIAQLTEENSASKDKLLAEREALTIELSGVNQSLDSLNQQLQRKEQEVTHLASQLSQLKDSYEREKTELYESAKVLSSRSSTSLQQMQEQLLALSLSKSKLAQENAIYQEQNQGLTQVIAELETNLNRLADKESKQANIHRLQIDSLKQTLTQNRLKLQNAAQQVNALSIERADLTERLLLAVKAQEKSQTELAALRLQYTDNQLLQTQTQSALELLKQDKGKLEQQLKQSSMQQADASQAQLTLLEQQLSEKDQAIAQLRRTQSELQLNNQLLKRRLKNDAQQTSELAEQLASKAKSLSQKQREIIRLESQLEQANQKYSGLNQVALRPASNALAPKLRSIDTSAIVKSSITNNNEQSQLVQSFGNFHALIIGNDNYQYLPNLNTAVADANRLEQILKDQYGYETTVLLNADRQTILTRLFELKKSLTDDTNLLIYYAGHGEISDSRGHWLPIDARPDNQANWIPTQQLTDMVALIDARKILIVADSCYSGVLTRSAILSSGVRGDINDKKYQRWLQAMAKGKSRTVLTSGGLQPVLDSGGGEHSLFAKHFLAALENNQGIIDAHTLYNQIFLDVKEAALVMNVDQSPQYAPIKNANHYSVDYFFINRQNL
ncbi:hypothetical protein DXX93_14785 [Thalassotalea euphylliae]|uniref:Caspase family p20 domain-containing protein n=1 Tax=Thalassotalea euphylliae TaxID=1655234 RepID=A0A3E0TT31_9GAMM|nr:caspase family protein [Thalassotalea euphylliae]REL27698.1 hypothetical protein DXX93_14785 [Thalassotalea euphylliae]